jgi:hypothetical protein
MKHLARRTTKFSSRCLGLTSLLANIEGGGLL